MKNKIIGIGVIFLLTGGFLIANAEADENWTLVEDAKYAKLSINTGTPVLVKQLQDEDYYEIEQALVNNSIPQISEEEMQTMFEDSNVMMVDNLLQNGKYLESNWQDLFILEKAKLIKVRTIDKVIEEAAAAFNVTIETKAGEKIIDLEKYLIDGIEITIPKFLDDFPGQFIMTPDGTRSFVATDTGLWEVIRNKLLKISKDDYDGENYSSLADQSIELYNQNIVIWNYDAIPDPSGTKLAYISNKHDIEANRNGVYFYDLNTYSERLIKSSSSFNYMADSWLDENKILCRVMKDDFMTYSIVTTDGQEYPLDLKGENPFVYSACNGLIAYAEGLGGDQIHIVEVTDSNRLIELADMKIDGSTRVRPGINAFSPNCEQFMCLYVPQNRAQCSFIKILNFKTGEEKTIDNLPARCGIVVEASWITDQELLIVNGKDFTSSGPENTWTYKLNGGNK